MCNGGLLCFDVEEEKEEVEGNNDDNKIKSSLLENRNEDNQQ